jgi:proteasome activator subunit 4
METPGVDEALRDLENEFSQNFIDSRVLEEAVQKGRTRSELRNQIYHSTVHITAGSPPMSLTPTIRSLASWRWRLNPQRMCVFLLIFSSRGLRSHTPHQWRYVQMSLNFLSGFLRRDIPVSPEVARFFVDQCSSPQPSMRASAQMCALRFLLTILTMTLTLFQVHCERFLPISNLGPFRKRTRSCG